MLTATTETVDELRAVLAATCAERSLVVCLLTSPELVAERLDAREPE